MNFKKAWLALLDSEKPKSVENRVAIQAAGAPRIVRSLSPNRPADTSFMRKSDKAHHSKSHISMANVQVDNEVRIIMDVYNSKKYRYGSRHNGPLALKKKYKLNTGLHRLQAIFRHLNAGAGEDVVKKIIANKASVLKPMHERAQMYMDWCRDCGIENPFFSMEQNLIDFFVATGVKISPQSVVKEMESKGICDKNFTLNNGDSSESGANQYVPHSELPAIFDGISFNVAWIEKHTGLCPAVNTNGGVFWPPSVFSEISYAIMCIADTKDGGGDDQRHVPINSSHKGSGLLHS